MILQRTKLYNQLHLIIPVLIVLGMFGFVRSDLFNSHQAIFTKALSFDLLIGIPVLYFLLQRIKKLDLKKVLKVFTLCLFVSTLLIPDSNLWIVTLTQTILYPLLKIYLVYKVIYKLIQLVREYRVHSLELNGFELYATTLRNTFSGKLGEILQMEFSVIYFLFSTKRKTQYKENEYGYTKIKGTVEMVYAFIFIIALETIVAHLLIAKLSILVAFVCTYSSLYLIILFISILKSRKHFPIIVEDKFLLLQYGFINKSIVKYTDIQKIEQTSRSNNDIMKLSAFKGVENHNLIIHFKSPQLITKVFGIQREYNSIGLFVDDPERFLLQLDTKQNL